MSSANIIDGKSVAARIKREASEWVRELADRGVCVSLDAIMVGDPAAGEIYARSQRTRCQEVGIEYRLHALPASAGEDEIRALIRRLNDDPGVTGILLNLPLPAGIDTPAMQYCIDPYKDVEGVNPANIGLLFYNTPIIAPCTALAVMEVLKDAQIKPGASPLGGGMDAVVVGQGTVAGKPIGLFLLHEGATVSCCHVATRDLALHTRQAELLVVAVGKPGLIHAEHVRPDAVVIDVGINAVVGPDGQRTIVGDVVFDEVKEVAKVLTPVPGGVGPVTVAILLKSAANAARMQLNPNRRVRTA